MLLHTYHYGSPSDPALVILHGFLGSADNWATLARKWSERFFVLAPDARNHGRSPHANEFDHPSMVRDVLELLTRHHLKRAHLLGHSMGGRTAMELALMHPELVHRLIVVDIGSKRYRSHHDVILDALQSVDLTIAKSRADVDAVLARSISEHSIRQFLMKNLQRTDEGAFRWKMNLPVLVRDYDRILEGLAPGRTFGGPTLLVRGSRSSYVPDADLPGIRQFFPAVRIESLDAGHWVHVERPEELSSLVLDFLSP